MLRSSLSLIANHSSVFTNPGYSQDISFNNLLPLIRHRVWFSYNGSPCLFTLNSTTLMYSSHPFTFHSLYSLDSHDTHLLNDYHFIQITAIPTSMLIKFCLRCDFYVLQFITLLPAEVPWLRALQIPSWQGVILCLPQLRMSKISG